MWYVLSNFQTTSHAFEMLRAEGAPTIYMLHNEYGTLKKQLLIYKMALNTSQE